MNNNQINNNQMEIDESLSLYFEPLTPQSQEIYDSMIKEINEICIGKSI
jgi:hypothetical protein